MKMFLTATTLAAGFALSLSVPVQAQSEKDQSRSESTSGQTQTIRGVLTGVTTVGETMFNYETGRGEIAQMSYLTIAGAPFRDEAGSHQRIESDRLTSTTKSSSRPNEPAPRTPTDPPRDRANDDRVQRTSAESMDSHDAARQFENIYLIAVTPQTEVCESRVGNKQRCEFANLELGDRIEVQFTRTGSQNTQARSTKHGRHRVIQGRASAVTILHKKQADTQPEESSTPRKPEGAPTTTPKR